MTGHLRRSRLTITVILVALAAFVWLPAPAQDTTLRLRLLSTTDIHTHIVDYDYYRDQRDISLGLARTAALIRQARGEVRNSLLFDSGDLIQGNPLGDYVAVEQRLQPGQVHPVFKAMNQLDYAAASLGNHEFVATNNYRASGGGNFPGMDGSNIVFETAETNQEIIKDWLIEQRTVNAAVTPIWSFAPITAPVQVVFESSPEAKSLVGGGTRIRHVGEGQNGFGLYALTPR